MNQVEKMNRMRTNLLKGVLWGSGVWAAMLLTWIVIVFNRAIIPASAYYPVMIHFMQWTVYASVLVVLFYLLRFWRYKWALRKDPSLRSALYDERVTLAWLKAYRFAFFTVVALHVLLLMSQSVGPLLLGLPGVRLPQFAEIPLTLLLALVASTGSFLYYCRED
jgi:hypothetical protein